MYITIEAAYVFVLLLQHDILRVKSVSKSVGQLVRGKRYASKIEGLRSREKRDISLFIRYTSYKQLPVPL